MTYPLLENAPPHDSPEFLSYLRKNNRVLYEDKHWIVIENCKYHKWNSPWLTAFLKEGVPNVAPLMKKFGTMEWKKKAEKKQTVKRFHIHMYELPV